MDQMGTLENFPSLKDLETSNLHSNRFHEEFAARMAKMSLGPERQQIVNKLLASLSEPITLNAYLRQTKQDNRK